MKFLSRFRWAKALTEGLYEEQRGLRTRMRWLVIFPIKQQVGILSFFHFPRMFIHHTDSGLLFASPARKGKGQEVFLFLSDCSLSASVTATKASDL